MKREDWLLIVDDNAATRYAMRRVLERQGYRVLEAGTGGEGLAHIAQSPVSVVILDVNLPDMSGFDVARQLRADPQTAVLPIIHVSAASVETRDIISGLDAGADAYLIHPIDPVYCWRPCAPSCACAMPSRHCVTVKSAFARSSPTSPRPLR